MNSSIIAKLIITDEFIFLTYTYSPLDNTKNETFYCLFSLLIK